MLPNMMEQDSVVTIQVYVWYLHGYTDVHLTPLQTFT